MNQPDLKKNDPLAKWLPYMCPSCRGLFKVNSDHAGPAQCPLCEKTVHIPKQAIAARTTQEVAALEPAKRVKRRRSTSSSREKQLNWESEQNSSHKHRKESKSKTPLLTAIAIFMALITGVGAFAIYQKFFNSADNLTAEQRAQKQSFYEQAKDQPESEPAIEVPEIDAQVLEQATINFLEADTLDELALYIRNSETLMPLIREYYRETGYQPFPYHSVTEGASMQASQGFVSILVTQADFLQKPIALELTDDGRALVDWESWVGYCEEPWESFISNQTTQSTLVRVKALESSYYNFNFSDDSQWACFELQRGTDDQILYGYCPKDAPYLTKLPSWTKEASAFVIKIKFPENPRTDNQVIITDAICSGWIPELAEQSPSQ